MSQDLLPRHENRSRRVLVKIGAANSTPGNFNDYLSRTAYLWGCDVFDAQVLTAVEPQCFHETRRLSRMVFI